MSPPDESRSRLSFGSGAAWQRGEGRRPPNRLGSQPIVIVAAYCAGAADEGTAGPVRRRAGRAMMKIIGTR